MALETGVEAPDFTLAREDGQLVTLKDYRGSKVVVLAFHPTSFTGG